MIILKRINMLLLYLSFIFIPSYLALAHGSKGEPIPDKVPLDKLSGIALLLAQLYNDDKLLFALLVIVIMVIVGLILGTLIDSLLKLFGMDISKIAHHE